MTRFLNKVVVVTGAASGIGRATALLFAQEGASVVVADIDTNGAEDTVRHIEKEGGRAITCTCDISNECDVRRLFEYVVDRLERLDVLVNCAAVFLMIGSEQASQKDWEQICAVNITGTALCSRYAAEQMQVSNGGAIVVVSSTNGIRADAGYATYSTSKAALLMMTRCMAIDYAKWRVRVNCVCPGAVDTPALHKELVRMQVTWKEFENEMQRNQCIHQVLQPKDIALAILFLASDQARMITGSNLIVDGGYLANK